MKNIGIVFARMDSHRFPCKVISIFRKKPLIVYVLERAALSQKLEQVVLATTERKIDDFLVQVVINAGFPVFRGPLDDVAARAIACAEYFQASSFARLNGDSPFIDIKLLDIGLSLQNRTDALLVSNLFPIRTYPYGIAVECLSTKKFKNIYNNLYGDTHEHITKYIYNHCPDEIIPLPPCKIPCPHIHLTIDTPEDLKRLNAMTRLPDYDYDDKIFQ